MIGVEELLPRGEIANALQIQKSPFLWTKEKSCYLCIDEYLVKSFKQYIL